MIMKAIHKLVSIASSPLAPNRASADRLALAFGRDPATSLGSLLQEKNGFYAFEGALHVFPDNPSAQEPDIVTWNDRNLWRSAYDGLADDGVFFAEDVFGNQFVSRAGAVFAFDAETASYEAIANGIEEWSELILRECNLHAGYVLAHAWQSRNGKIESGRRLLPRKPFVLGGEYSVANLYSANAIGGMRFRGHVATQIRDVPDGSTIRLRVVE